MLETATIAVSGFMIKKYVFLEPDIEPPKTRRITYLVGFVLIAATFFIFGKDATIVPTFALIGWSIYVGRKEHKLRGLLMMIPLPGIIDGFTVPIMRVPPYLLSLSGGWKDIYQFAVYIVLILLLIVFYFKGKSWRAWFNENTRDRRLRRSEWLLICLTGVVMQLFAKAVSSQIEDYEGDFTPQLAAFMGIISVTAVVMTIMIIVLIMQGNKRSYYHNQVSEMQFSIITLMADIVENRDNNTGGHIKRTAEYVRMIASELKSRGAYSEILTDNYIENMIVAAPLHDIGKIHISDVILNKPGKLTDEEFEIMKTHTSAGRDLLVHAKEELGESQYLDMAIEMAAYHHEKWNGSGYPCGLKGDEIPLCARIMAVADVFDALSAKRCYKEAMPLEKAISIIREETDTHFDPVVSEAFLAAIKKLSTFKETK